MSHQTGSQSGELSGRVVALFEFMRIDITGSFGSGLHYVIRKGAHLFEYFVLSLLFYNYLKECLTRNKVFTLSILSSFLYACTDELHQTFIPNRAGSFNDVMIDTIGAALAILMVFLYRKVIK